jgi:hypothetical protein
VGLRAITYILNPQFTVAITKRNFRKFTTFSSQQPLLTKAISLVVTQCAESYPDTCICSRRISILDNLCRRLALVDKVLYTLSCVSRPADIGAPLFIRLRFTAKGKLLGVKIKLFTSRSRTSPRTPDPTPRVPSPLFLPLSSRNLGFSRRPHRPTTAASALPDRLPLQQRETVAPTLPPVSPGLPLLAPHQSTSTTIT